MAEPKPRNRGPDKRGRTTVIAALAAVVAVVAVWLSNCIPGFGMGSSGSGKTEADSDGKVEAAKPEIAQPDPDTSEPAKPEPAKPEPPRLGVPQPGTGGATLTVNIGVAGCAIAGADPVDCSKICERAELFEGIDDAVLEVTGASHGSVVAMIDCLKSKGIDKVAIRRESP